MRLRTKNSCFNGETAKAAGAHAARRGLQTAYFPYTSGLKRKDLNQSIGVGDRPPGDHGGCLHEVELVARYAQMLQIGAEHAKLSALARGAGQAAGSPKRGIAATIDMVDGGGVHHKEDNYQVVLCERGSGFLRRRPEYH